jgi:uncharacterized protein
MNLEQTIKNDLLQAQKAKDQTVVSTLRLLTAAWQNRQIALRKTAADADKTLGEEEVIAVLKNEIKKRQEAAEAFSAGNRPELAAKEQQELEILQKYLPPQLTTEQIREIVKAKISQTGAAGPKDFGKVMGLAMAETKGAADGGMVSKIVKELLSSS